MKALILGFGVSGKAAAEFLLGRGYSVVAVDRQATNLTAITEVTLKGEEDPINIEEYDFLVLSPGIPLSHSLCQQARAADVEVLGEIELAARHVKQKFFGITGTNGKTTVALLVGHILNANGYPARVVGNVGVPLISQVSDNDDILVVELSSYQLEILRSKVVDVGLVLNISPDHLDRYNTMEAYATAKFRMKDCLKDGGLLYIEEQCAQEYNFLLENTPFKTFGFSSLSDVFALNDRIINEKVEYMLPLRYKEKVDHDIKNIVAANVLCHAIGISPEGFCCAVDTFNKPPHRIEFVREVGGVSYYNDSKGTNVAAVEIAVDSMGGGTILIAGGVDKGGSYKHWREAFKGKVKRIIVLGQAADKIKEELASQYEIDKMNTLQEAVLRAKNCANSGDNVLLSPGCASFDMFNDYAHRGDEFKKIVLEQL